MTKATEAGEAKGWSLLWAFLRDKPIVDVFSTCGLLFLHPRRFTDEVLKEDWSNKAKPPRFLIETYLLTIPLSLLTPWRLLEQSATPQTELQKNFGVAADLINFAVAFFAASFAVHLCLGYRRLPFIRAFFLFCYIQGMSVFVSHLTVAFLWLLDRSPSRSGLLITAVFELVAFLVVTAYAVAPILRAYQPRWYRFVLACLVGIGVFALVALGGSSVSDAIASHFPPQ